MIYTIRRLRYDQIEVKEATHWAGSSVAWTAEQGGYAASAELKFN